jgi:hypothetical protein
MYDETEFYVGLGCSLCMYEDDATVQSGLKTPAQVTLS